MHLQHKDAELIAAVECGNEAAVSTLLAGGADANTISGNGDRALMLAARDGYTGCINALTNGGAAVDQARQDDGITALMLSAMLNQHGACHQLLELGADQTLKATDGDWAGMTAQELAQAQGQVGTAALLVAWVGGTREVAELDSVAAAAEAAAEVRDLPEPLVSFCMIRFIRAVSVVWFCVRRRRLRWPWRGRWKRGQVRWWRTRRGSPRSLL